MERFWQLHGLLIAAELGESSGIFSELEISEHASHDIKKINVKKNT